MTTKLTEAPGGTGEHDPPPTWGRVADDHTRISPPVHVHGPGGAWHLVRAGMTHMGNAVVHTTWGEWLPAVRADPALRPILDGDEDRHWRTTDPTIRCRFAASRLVTRYTAAAALGIDPGDVELTYEVGGRPRLRGFGAVEISLTHTRDLVAVGVSRTGRIGVDAEHRGRAVDFGLLSGHTCTPAELRALHRLPGGARDTALLELWTLKEACSKALGRGLQLGFTEFGLCAGDPPPPGLDGAPAEAGRWAFTTHQVQDGYLLSAARLDEDRTRPPGRPATERRWGRTAEPLEKTGVSPAAHYRTGKVVDMRRRAGKSGRGAAVPPYGRGSAPRGCC